MVKNRIAPAKDAGKPIANDPFFTKSPRPPKRNATDQPKPKFQKNKKLGEQPKEGRVEKRPFDKKKWRLQKYSKKYKLEQFEERRKKSVLHEYYQQLRHERPKTDVKKIYEQYDESDDERGPRNYVQHPDYDPKGPKRSTRTKVRLEMERIKKEKEAKKEEAEKRKQEQDEAMKKYRAKKIEKNKKLNKKTKRGQPVMKGRIEMLLEKIQNS